MWEIMENSWYFSYLKRSNSFNREKKAAIQFYRCLGWSTIRLNTTSPNRKSKIERIQP